MFEVLKRFTQRHKQKEEKQRSLQQNAMRILKRDHLMAKLQSEQGTLAEGSAVTSPVLAEPAISARPESVAATAYRPGEFAQNPEPAVEVSVLPEFNPPPGFEAELKRLSKLMDFDD